MGEDGSTAVVATLPTAAEAELLRRTLVAHGFHATTSAADPAYPSLDFAQGMWVKVPLADREEARRLAGESPQP